jgi:serine/threonine-protein kinase
MSEQTHDHDGTLQLSAKRRVNEACNRFELAWQAGRRPHIEDYLGEVTSTERPALLRELVALEVYYRQQAGEAVTPDEYRDRFPDLRLAPLLNSFPAAAAESDSPPPSAPSTGRDTSFELPGEVAEIPVQQPALEQPPPGKAGRNLLYEEIARGGMGAVLRGRDPTLGRDLAVKVLLEEHRANPELTRRFLEEAQIGGQLQHPGIVPVYELGRDEADRPFFTMKLVKGQTLAALLKQRASPQADLPRLLAIFEQVCQTLAYAHSRGVIHRDLKPANVMVGAFGEVQVMDWGMAKVLPRSTGVAAGQGLPPAADEATVISTARSGLAAEASQPGTVLGTPSFMPPEQARGEIDQIDERADVFGLGAILCVILTGKPPYTGSTYEVYGSAMEGDLAGALARLDGCEADAELVQMCKECLAVEREDRPRDAGAVARRVVAYQAGVQERLRRAELERAAAEERAAGERKRRKLLAGLAAAFLALVVVGAGSAVWLQHKEADRREALARRETELRQGVETNLQTAAALRDQARWATARQVLARTRERLGETGPADLHEQLGQATAALELAARLDDIRQKRSVIVEGKFDTATALREYPAAFAEAGLGRVGDDEAAVAARVRGSAVKAQLVAALDDWASITHREEDRLLRWLLGVARQADPAPAWRDRFRDPGLRRDQAALERLAREAKMEELSPQVVSALGQALLATGADAVPLLREAQRLHPDDFWLSFTLGNACDVAKKPEEAAGHYRAARALQPRSVAVRYNLGVVLSAQGEQEEAVKEYREALRLAPKEASAHTMLGNALFAQGEREEAIKEYREALRLDPKLAPAHNNLGNALFETGEWEEAIKEYREGLRLDPKLAPAHNNLGKALYGHGEREEAIKEFREALRLDPKDATAHTNLGAALAAQGEREEAIKEYREALRLDPKHAPAHYNLGIALNAKGELEEAIKEYREGLRLDPKHAPAHYNLGIALNAKGELEEAIKEYREALRLDPKHAKAHTNLGGVLYAQGKREEAIKEYREALRLDPKYALAHGALGEALLAQGHYAEARDATRRCLDLLPERAPQRQTVNRQLGQCERLVALEEKLPALLGGKDKPADNPERLTLAWMCLSHKKLYVAAVHFYEDAIAADAKLADNPGNGHRYNAACAAALAGCGQGNDADKLDEKERTRLRHQAVEWLRADLALWTKLADSANPKAREVVQQTLRHWQTDADLAGTRDKDALAKLPAEEQEAWRKLWAEVETLRLKVGGKAK